MEVTDLLDLTYSQQTISEYLKELKFSIIEPFINDELHMRGEIVTDGVTFDTIVCIPKKVPPSYPTFYFVDSGLELQEAHVERPKVYSIENGKKNVICRTCIRDERDKVYSASAVDLFHNLYRDFEGLCAKITNKEFDSKLEMFREFDSYWANDFSLYWDIKDVPTQFSLLDEFVISNGNSFYQIATDRPEDIRKFAATKNYRVTIQKAFYIDLGENMPYPLLHTYSDLKKFFEDIGVIKEINKLNKQISSRMVYLGFNLPSGEKHYVGVLLAAVRAVKKKKMDITEVLSFKPFQEKVFMGGHTKSLDYGYLMSRGGHTKNKDTSSKNIRIAIVGCGSVGSTLAYKLSKSGIRDFVLIDPGRLRLENIGRHQLGMSEVANYKAESLSKYLESQFVGLKANFVNSGAEDSGAQELLKDVDLIVSAIGSDAPAVEPWLSEQTSKGLLPEMVTCWLEADGVGGHILRTKKDEVFNFNKTCDRLNILDPIYSASLLMPEVGCNSTYMPYAFLDADIHINKMAHFILSIVNDEDNDMRALSSIGDISKYKDNLVKEVTNWSTIEYVQKTLPF